MMSNEDAIFYLKQVREDYECSEFVEGREALDLAIKALEERQQGEWTNEWHEIKGGRIYGACCSLCHINGHSGYNFCPNCGADMRKGGAE